MYDTEISANIIHTFNSNRFINEISTLPRVLLILAISLLNVLLLNLFKAKRVAVNILIAGILFIGGFWSVQAPSYIFSRNVATI